MTTIASFGAGLRRRFFAACVALGSLLAAVQPTGAQDLSAFPPPVVVVYPFTVSGSGTGTVSEAGGNVALLLSNRLAELGGVTVKPFMPGTTRADYLTAALKQGADYYVTGFLTPIGAEVSLITQIVSTYGGTVVWSNTITVRTYADALGQADPLRTAILAHAERGLAALPHETAPVATAAPDTHDAAGVNLSRALGRRHRNDASPAPTATAAATAAVTVAQAPSATPAPTAKPTPVPTRAVGALVTEFSGDADTALRYEAVNAFVGALRRVGVTHGGIVAISPQDALAHIGDLCRANAGAQAVYVGTLGVDAVSRAIHLEVSAYACDGTATGTQSVTETPRKHESLAGTVDRAATAAVAAFAAPQR